MADFSGTSLADPRDNTDNSVPDIQGAVASQGVTPQLPGSAPVLAAPPMVGDANDAATSLFTQRNSDLNSYLDTVRQQRGAEMDAIKASQAVDQSTTASLVQLNTSSEAAVRNLQKASSLPGGAQGSLAQIVGLFNSDYNAEYQASTIKINTLEAESIKMKSDAQKSAIRAMPDLLAKQSEFSKSIIDAEQSNIQNYISLGTLDTERQRARIDAIHASIAMTQEQRAQAQQAVDSLDSSGLQAAYSAAKKGDKQWAPLAGFLQDRIIRTQLAEANARTAVDAAARGDIETHNMALLNMAKNMNYRVLNGLIGQSQAANKPFVSIPTGKGKSLDLPYAIAQQAVNEAAAEDQKASATAAQEVAVRAEIPQRYTTTVNTLSSLAATDPRAGQLATALSKSTQGVSMNDPYAVTRFATVLKSYQDQADTLLKEQAEKYTAKDAQAAVMSWGHSGQFDGVGGAAVASESLTTPSLYNPASSKYADAWKVLGNTVATQLNRGGIGNLLNAVKGGASDTQNQSIILSSAKEKVNEVAKRVLADPATRSNLQASVEGEIRSNAIGTALNMLQQNSKSDPTWSRIAQTIAPLRNAPNGAFVDRLAQEAQKATVAAGGKVDYAKQFFDAMAAADLRAKQTDSSDVRNTAQNQALIGALYGFDPSAQVRGALHSQLRARFDAARELLQQQIQQDISGRTDATQAQINAGFTTDNPQANAMPAPSATGIGTVDQIRRMFPTGLQ